MSMQSRKEILQKKHKEVDNEILALESAMHLNHLEITRLKKLKLSYKDEITRLSKD
jgi:hypothetical protein